MVPFFFVSAHIMFVVPTAQIGQLEATKLQNESTIAELEAALNKMKDKLAWLESERNNLELQKSSMSQSQQSQLKSLEKVRRNNVTDKHLLTHKVPITTAAENI